MARGEASLPDSPSRRKARGAFLAADHFELFEATSIADLANIGQASWSRTTGTDLDRWLHGLLSDEAGEAYLALVAHESMTVLRSWGNQIWDGHREQPLLHDHA